MNDAKIHYTYIGFDFGLKRIGVAVGQMVTKTASPLPILNAKNGIPNWQEIKKILDSWKPQALIIGIPLQMENRDASIIPDLAKKFADTLYVKFSIPVYMIDEKLTTKAAREYIYDNFGYKALQKQPIDSFAAKIILESWFNKAGNE